MTTSTPTVIPALPDWNGIPIMPGAVTDLEDTGGYQFTINASATDITNYYKQEMANRGWELRPDMMASIPTDLAFQKGGTFVFFKIVPNGNNNQVWIHLVQQ